MSAYVVVDTGVVGADGTCPVLGRFPSEDEAAAYIETLPEHLTGRYDLTGPPEDWDSASAPSPGWGELYGGADDPYRTADGPVWMFRKGQRVRFYDWAGQQVGPEQANVAPAVTYAASQDWRNSVSDALGVSPRAELKVNPVKIKQYGSLPSCKAWYVIGAPVPSGRFRTRTEARAWCDANGIPWRTS